MFKSPCLNYTALFSPQAIYEAMKARSNSQEKSSNLEYLQVEYPSTEFMILPYNLNSFEDLMLNGFSNSQKNLRFQITRHISQ